jgi:hypothetical protein
MGVLVQWLGGKRGRLRRAMRHITASARRVNRSCQNDPAVQHGGVKANRILVVTFHPLYDHGSTAWGGGAQRDISYRG